jgi:zinc transporter
MNAPLDWKHLDFTDPEAIRWTRRESGINRIAADALVAEDSRPREVSFENGTLVILRGVNLNPGSELEDMVSIRIWLEPGRVVSTSRRRLKSVDEIRAGIDAGQGPHTPGRFLVKLIQRLGDFISDTVEKIEEALEAAEDQTHDPYVIARNSPFSALRRQSARIRRYMAPQRDALDRLSRSAGTLFSAEELAGFREEANRLTLILEDLELVSERAMVAQEEFMARVAHEQNTRMLVLSIIAAIFLPLSFLTGLMGMNVAGLPGTVNVFSFWILLVLMLSISGVILAIFRYRKWI